MTGGNNTPHEIAIHAPDGHWATVDGCFPTRMVILPDDQQLPIGRLRVAMENARFGRDDVDRSGLAERKIERTLNDGRGSNIDSVDAQLRLLPTFDTTDQSHGR